jgi:starch synthase
VPVVRATGGLADTIVDATPEAISAGAANGFTFREYSQYALGEALRRAVDMRLNHEQWRQLVLTGMQQDWSWKRSAEQYVNLYQRIATKAKQEQRVAN